jgi:RNA polymerase sigma-70 factor (ECF subfamily)
MWQAGHRDREQPSVSGDDSDYKIGPLLAAIKRGESSAMGELIDLIYPELKRLAHFQLSMERPDHTLNTTAVVHEAYLRLVDQGHSWNNRGHFLRAAATVMRHLLVDHARRRNAAKRGDGIAALTLQEDRHASDDDTIAVLALDDALTEIGAVDPRLVQIIECRYFAGLDVSDTAEALDLSVRTVERDSQRARGYLLRALDGQ